MNEYKQGDTIYILMDSLGAEGVLEDWLEHKYESPLIIHQSKKNAGKIVVETKDPMWAGRVVKWHRYEKITYKSK